MISQRLVTDNVTEVLLKIIRFTEMRHELLVNNITRFGGDEFEPKDLDNVNFAAVLGEAVEEHSRTRRLLLRDTGNIKFGCDGSFSAEPILDQYANELLEKDINKYIVFEVSKISENLLNYQLAVKLLKAKDGVMSAFTTRL
ncbi:MAG: hypothetical protein ABIG61_03425 [Planctomycetota bacterium]